MRDIILGLKRNEIITEKNILDLKNYIAKKYPGSNSKEVSLILADSINKIIEKSISQFDEKNRMHIRNSLVRRALAKNRFDISAYEVFCEYIGNTDKSEKSLDALVDWINGKQEKSIKREEVISLVSALDIKNGSIPDEAVEAVLGEIVGNSEQQDQLIEKSSDEETKLSDNIEAVNINYDGSLELGRLQSFVKKYEMFLSAVKGSVLLHYKKICISISGCLFIILLGLNLNKITALLQNDVVNSLETEIQDNNYGQENLMLGSELPEDFRYIEIDRMTLKGWLNGRNSILAEEPYFSTILDTAKRYDISPLLMFSIAGQEQGFVPKDQVNAAKIANNPFNVYGSWQVYNTNIKDASEIAARTIISLSKGKPEDADVIEWINRKYAEDKNWWKGVSRIYSDLKKDIIQ